jgi:hypothetical protein
VKVPTSGGITGMIRPIETMSISTVIMMKGIAAWRRARADDADVSVLKGFLVDPRRPLRKRSA